MTKTRGWIQLFPWDFVAFKAQPVARTSRVGTAVFGCPVDSKSRQFPRKFEPSEIPTSRKRVAPPPTQHPATPLPVARLLLLERLLQILPGFIQRALGVVVGL